ncbi:hypothetical protein [Gemella sp. zg-1178]|nr:hypothetical protein [Gemella sp. zg-1178]
MDALFYKSKETISYKKPVPIPGRVSISLETKGDPESFYLDGI